MARHQREPRLQVGRRLRQQEVGGAQPRGAAAARAQQRTVEDHGSGGWRHRSILPRPARQ
jgi:hypothetical protein